MLVLVTLGFAVFVGVMGMAVDLGFVALERRNLQKAADAAAMSGAIDLMDEANYTLVGNDVTNMVGSNNVAFGTTTNCQMVDNNNVVVQANCNTPTVNTISGVRVTLSRLRPNFFMGVLGLNNTNVSATATARVQSMATYNAGAVLFIVCGDDTKVAGIGNNTFDILESTVSGYRVKEGAVGKRYLIHGPQVADCGAQNTNFKGLYGETGMRTLPGNLLYEEGTVAGPTIVAVDGPDGCVANITTFNGCVMVLPVAAYSVGSPSDKTMYAVMWLPFEMYTVSANVHEGVLVSETYQLRNSGSSALAPWALGGQGLVTARLVN